ncbi:hypothetical protein R6G00_35535 [Streptomyces roseofulvus]|uniref:Lipoprotein n=2 Tax=Streptomyces TaxID=1883 RepID=A0ABU4KIA5_9ACTN|nr:hypothetical protein [Streptomyces roseolus]
MAVVFSTACGPFRGDPAGPELVGRAIRATESAKSVTLHMDGLSLTVPMKGRVSLDTRGNCTATMSYGTAGTAELIRINGKDVYLRRDETLLRTQERHRSPKELDALVDKVRGRWTRPPVDGPDAPAELTLCDRVPLPPGLGNGWDDDSANGEPATVDGHSALKLVRPDSESETTVYVAAEDPPYLLKIVTKGGESPGTTTYSHYDRPVEAKAPAPEDIVLTD